MYRYKHTIITIALLLTPVCYASAEEPRENHTKTGWSFTPLPALGYSSDLGLQLGAILDVYYFGDGSRYPEYLHKFTAQASWYTKGSGMYHLFYDSKYLIPGLRFTATASYIPNTMMSFYGFNGYASPYSKDMSNAFYAIKRNMGRVMADIQGNLGGNFSWSAGISYYNYAIDKVQVQKYRDETTLYDLYVQLGLIREGEKHGGNHLELRLGAVYDSRDHEPDPARGIYANAIVYGSPDIIDRRGNNYLKAAASFSHYIPLINKRLTLAYRLSYQGTVAGSVPFYTLQTYATLFMRQVNTDILGGATSIRGIGYGRITGDAVAWANVEARARLFRFRFIGQEWYTAANPFFDIGMAVRPYRLDEMKNVQADRDMIYSGDTERPHMSAGLGLKLVMNENFVLSAEFGKALDRRDGNTGMYLNLNYVF